MFKQKSVETVQSLQQESQGILNVFEKTKSDLENVNGRINNQFESRRIEIQRLLDEQAQLEVQKTQNTKVINKISEFLA
jgi:hypothetical protein